MRQGKPSRPDTEGYLVLKNPWPAMLRTIYGDPDRYVKPVLEQVPRRVHHGRFRETRQGRLLLDHRPSGRRDQGLGSPPGHRRS